MLFKEWQHSIIEQIRSCNRSLAIIELGKGHLAVGIDERLSINPSPRFLESLRKRYLVLHSIQDIRTIPIVFLGAGSDPVILGLVDTLARPGGNLTGVSSIASSLAGKRLELLKETIPKLSRVAVLWNPQNAGSTRSKSA